MGWRCGKSERVRIRKVRISPEILFKYGIAMIVLANACSCSLIRQATVCQTRTVAQAKARPLESSNALKMAASQTGFQIFEVLETSDNIIFQPASQVSEPSEPLDNINPQTSEISEFRSDLRLSDFSEWPEVFESQSGEHNDIQPDSLLFKLQASDSEDNEDEWRTENKMLPDSEDNKGEWQIENKMLPDSDFYSSYSEKLGIDLDGTENKELIIKINEWLGTRYKWGGNSKRGIDCSALVQSIYKDVYGIALSRTSESILKNDITVRIKKQDLQEGDILCFRIKGNKISHIGLYVKKNKFVHAIKKGVVISDLSRRYYGKRFVIGGRVIKDSENISSSPPDPDLVKFVKHHGTSVLQTANSDELRDSYPISLSSFRRSYVVDPGGRTYVRSEVCRTMGSCSANQFEKLILNR